MDFDIGNILYMVITLVAIIASLLGKKKKPAGKTVRGSRPVFWRTLSKSSTWDRRSCRLWISRRYEEDLPEEVESSEYEYDNAGFQSH